MLPRLNGVVWYKDVVCLAVVVVMNCVAVVVIKDWLSVGVAVPEKESVNNRH